MSMNRTKELTPDLLITRSRHTRLCLKAMIRDIISASVEPGDTFHMSKAIERQEFAHRIIVQLQQTLNSLAIVESLLKGEAPALTDLIPLDPERVRTCKYQADNDPDLPKEL